LQPRPIEGAGPDNLARTSIRLRFYIRRATGARVWRAIHFAVFAVFVMATVHGATSGSDSGALVYWTAAGTILFLTIHRLLRALAAGRLGIERAPNDRERGNA
jgi:hypothetical protein